MRSDQLCSRTLNLGLAAAIAVAALVATIGCGSSGTAGPEGSSGDDYELLISGAQLENYEHWTDQTILGAELWLDGQRLKTVTYTSPQSSALLSTGSTLTPAGRGRHVLEMRITDQTSSPNLYAMNPQGFIYARDVNDGSEVIVSLYVSDIRNPVQGWLETGESLQLEFVLP